ncbi:DMT family transporter [Mesobacillus sp. AQ2]|uniref:DMT family transporter n=1 Tax=Mesobacillus sp. AQ2 TaxID=3043332 RepID=UPI0024C1D5A6|nr:DMT family transporter [Mesobacillus sp. AQ2]WHX40301.1 DMT family transporter [Mesobacillus sp. AQ2]
MVLVNLLPFFLAFIGGLLISIQGLLNSAGSKIIGIPALIAWLSIIQAIPPLIYLLNRQPVIGISQTVTQGFKWYAVSGVIGVIVVASLSFSISKAGALSIFVVLVLGQIIGSALIDQIGLFGTPIKPMNGMKLLSILLIVLGVFLLLKSEPSANSNQSKSQHPANNEINQTVASGNH